MIKARYLITASKTKTNNNHEVEISSEAVTPKATLFTKSANNADRSSSLHVLNAVAKQLPLQARLDCTAYCM
jgi:hypothetical protein